MSQPLIPVLLTIASVWLVLGGLLAADIIWSFVPYSFVNPTLANAGAMFTAVLKWPSALTCAIYLFAHRRYVLAIVALVWPLLAGFVNFPVVIAAALLGLPRQPGVIELALAEKIGYVGDEASL